MGIEATIETHTTMEMMPNFLARFESTAAFSGSVVVSALTELIRDMIPMQEIPQMMLQMASFLWYWLSLQEAAPCPVNNRIMVSLFRVSPVPGMVFSGTSSSTGTCI